MDKKRVDSIRNLRTVQKTRLRSKPKAHGQEFITLYILERQKDRCEREKERAAESLKHVLKDMAEISNDVEQRWAEDKAALEMVKEEQTLEAGGESSAPSGRVPIKPFKSMPLDY